MSGKKAIIPKSFHLQAFVNEAERMCYSLKEIGSRNKHIYF